MGPSGDYAMPDYLLCHSAHVLLHTSFKAYMGLAFVARPIGAHEHILLV